MKRHLASPKLSLKLVDGIFHYGLAGHNVLKCIQCSKQGLFFAFTIIHNISMIVLCDLYATFFVKHS